MTRLDLFSKRYHKIKQTLQELAESDLQRANEVEQAATFVLQNIAASAQEARMNRIRQTSGLDWVAWTNYIIGLERQYQLQQVHVETAAASVIERRHVLNDAYREKMRYATLVRQVETKQAMLDEQSQQKTADEHATMRFERS